MVSDTWASFVKLPHDATGTMEQVNSELCVHGHTSVGLALTSSPQALCGGRLHQKPRLVSTSGHDGARDLGKLCKAAS